MRTIADFAPGDVEAGVGLALQDDVKGINASTAEQLIWSLDPKPTLPKLIDEGANIVAGGEKIDTKTRLYPIGTASALARLLRCKENPEHVPYCSGFSSH